MEVNRRAKFDKKIRDALRKYEGKTLVFKVIDDAVYVFAITAKEVKFTMSPPHYSGDDLYLEMDKERASRLVYEREVSIFDILFGNIKWRNITLADVNFFRELLSSYSGKKRS